MNKFPKQKFANLSVTRTIKEGTTYSKLLLDYFRQVEGIAPSKPLPSVKTHLKDLDSELPTVIWFGHSSYLIHYKGFNILVDPVFSEHASPIPGTIRAYPGSNIYKPSDIPTIDALIITHNHYDHLDKNTLKKLRHKIRTYYVPLGVGKCGKSCRINDLRITEMDWWQTEKLAAGIMLTSVPARHMSGRGFRQNRSLWSAYVLSLGPFRIFLGGDSGYDTHFKAIGERFGYFDLAILECGQYDKNWPDIHMQPEEAAQAAIDLNARVLMPVHWGKFTLAHHPWDEPVTRLLKKTDSLGLLVTTPLIGQAVIISSSYPHQKWWQ